MNLTETINRLSELSVVPAQQLQWLRDVAPDDLPRLSAELAAVFDVLDDAPKKNGKLISAMGFVVSALDEVRSEQDAAEAAPVKRRPVVASGRRAPLGTFNSGMPAKRAAPALRLSAKVLTASAQDLGDRDAVVAHLTQAMNLARRKTGSSQTSVFTAQWGDAYPEDRTLTADPWLNEQKMAAIAQPEALAAAGGICGPVDVDYSVITFADDSRPLTTGLPSFKATRGGVQFIEAPTLASIGASATTVWTHAQDAATPFANPDGTLPAGTTVKPVQTIFCPTTSEVLVDAIPTRLQVGNMVANFSPEWVAAFTDTVMANAARVGELNTLTALSSYSTSVSSGQLLGATRDLLATLDQVVAAYRYRNRLADSMPLTTVMPRWIIQMLRADLTREIAHGEDNNLDLSDSAITSLITARGVTPIWTMDGLAANATGVPYPTQGFAAQAQGGLVDWPHSVVWHVFTTGTIVHLDGGSLDLSIIRSSELNAVNAFETMTETFEGLLYRGGPEVLQIVSALRPNGASAGTIATSTY